MNKTLSTLLIFLTMNTCTSALHAASKPTASQPNFGGFSDPERKTRSYYSPYDASPKPQFKQEETKGEDEGEFGFDDELASLAERTNQLTMQPTDPYAHIRSSASLNKIQDEDNDSDNDSHNNELRTTHSNFSRPRTMLKARRRNGASSSSSSSSGSPALTLPISINLTGTAASSRTPSVLSSLLAMPDSSNLVAITMSPTSLRDTPLSPTTPLTSPTSFEQKTPL